MSKTIADRHVLSQLNDCGEGDYLSSFSCRALCVCVCSGERELLVQFNIRVFPLATKIE